MAAATEERAALEVVALAMATMVTAAVAARARETVLAATSRELLLMWLRQIRPAQRLNRQTSWLTFGLGWWW